MTRMRTSVRGVNVFVSSLQQVQDHPGFPDRLPAHALNVQNDQMHARGWRNHTRYCQYNLKVYLNVYASLW